MLALLCLAVSPAFGQSSRYLARGFVYNRTNAKCWYTQVTDRDNTYFYAPQMQIVGIMTFEDPKCMSGTGVDAGILMMIINNLISTWYGNPDAQYKTRPSEMFKGSKFQKKGRCIQSSKYPTQGISVDYIVVNNSIVRVMHGMSYQGCLK